MLPISVTPLSSTDLSSEQKKNTLSLSTVTLDGTITDVISILRWNAPEAIYLISEPSFTSPLHLSPSRSAPFTITSGDFSRCAAIHGVSSNTFVFHSIIWSGNSTFSSDLQYSNALIRTFSTLSGIVTDVRSGQLLNA